MRGVFGKSQLMTNKIEEFVESYIAKHWGSHPKPNAISLIHVKNMLYEFNKIESIEIIEDLLDNMGVAQSASTQRNQQYAMDAAKNYLKDHKL